MRVALQCLCYDGPRNGDFEGGEGGTAYLRQNTMENNETGKAKADLGNHSAGGVIGKGQALAPTKRQRKG